MGGIASSLLSGVYPPNSQSTVQGTAASIESSRPDVVQPTLPKPPLPKRPLVWARVRSDPVFKIEDVTHGRERPDRSSVKVRHISGHIKGVCTTEAVSLEGICWMDTDPRKLTRLTMTTYAPDQIFFITYSRDICSNSGRLIISHA